MKTYIFPLLPTGLSRSSPIQGTSLRSGHLHLCGAVDFFSWIYLHIEQSISRRRGTSKRIPLSSRDRLDEQGSCQDFKPSAVQNLQLPCAQFNLINFTNGKNRWSNSTCDVTPRLALLYNVYFFLPFKLHDEALEMIYKQSEDLIPPSSSPLHQIAPSSSWELHIPCLTFNFQLSNF